VAAIADARGLPRDRRVGGEVLGGEQPAAAADPVHHRGGDVARVERRRALLTEASDRISQFRQRERVADLGRRAAGEERRGALRRAPDDPGQDVEEVRLDRRDHDAGPRELRGGGGEVRERHGAPALHRGLDAGGRPVGAAGRRADVERLLRLAGEVDEHLDERRALAGEAEPRRGDEEVQERRLPPGPGDEQVAARPRAGEQRLGGPRREHRRDRGVDGVAAVGQDASPGRGGDVVPGGDDAACHQRPFTSAAA
jgi:hypothetical protein